MTEQARVSSEMRRRFSCSEISALEDRLDADIGHYSSILERLARDSSDETMMKVCGHKNLPAREKFAKLIDILLEIQRHSERHVRDFDEEEEHIDEAQRREQAGRLRDSGVVSVNSEALAAVADLPFPVEETQGPEKCQGSVPSCSCSKVSDCSTMKEENKETLTNEEEDNAINDLQQQNQTSLKLYAVSSETPSSETPVQVLSDLPANLSDGFSADSPGGLSASPPEALRVESAEQSGENRPGAPHFYLPDETGTDKDKASEC